MYDFRAQLTYTDTRRLAPFGEGCALFSALCACVFVFLIGFTDRRGLPISLLDAFGQNTPGSAFSVCAALLGLAAVCVLFVLTVLRYVRFWLKKHRRTPSTSAMRPRAPTLRRSCSFPPATPTENAV